MKLVLRAAFFSLFVFSVVARAETKTGASATPAATPGAPHLLPRDTLLYARFDNAEEIRTDLADSSVGRMLADPQLKPFAGDMYATLTDIFATIGKDLGITLDELLAIPSGQVAAAMVPGSLSAEQIKQIEDDGDESEEAIRRRIDRKRRAQTSFGGLFVIDAGDNIDKLRELLDRLLKKPLDSGYVKRQESVGDVTLVHLLPPRPGRPAIEYFEKDQCLVLGIGHETASKALNQWLDKSEEPTLADNVDFANVMGRCIGSEDTQPQLTFYADPFHLVERLIKRGGAAALVWPIVEDLGIAKIRGIGGSVFRGGETFDDISHLHILIDPPRDGFFGVLRPEVVETMPPNFVPADVSTYLTFNWDFETTYDNIGKIVDRFNGENTFKQRVEDELKQRSGVDLREEFIANMSGRYVSMRWYQPPAKINSQSQLFGFEMKDAGKAEATIEKFIQAVAPNVKAESLGKYRLYAAPLPPMQNSPNLRQPEPALLLLGNWVLFGDSRQLMERASRAESGALERLAEEPDFDLVASELGGKLDGEKPFMLSFVRGAEFLRQFYQLADSENSKALLKKASENNPVAAKLFALLQRNQLPPFEKFEKYFAPGGAFAYDEATGVHIGSFTLRAD